MANVLIEIDWSLVKDEDIPCAKVDGSVDNKNLWLHPCGEVRAYKNWWYLDDDGLPRNAVDDGILTELKDTEAMAEHIEEQLKSHFGDRLGRVVNPSTKFIQ